VAVYLYKDLPFRTTKAILHKIKLNFVGSNDLPLQSLTRNWTHLLT